MTRHSNDAHFRAFRRLIDSIQTLAEQIALSGAVGPLLAWDAIQESGVRRFRFANVAGMNDRILLTEILANLRHCSHTIPVSLVLLRTQLVRPQPDLQVRATVIGYSVSSEHVWCSEATLLDQADQPAVWCALNDDRLTKLIEPAAAYVRFCHAQGVAYA